MIHDTTHKEILTLQYSNIKNIDFDSYISSSDSLCSISI